MTNVEDFYALQDRFVPLYDSSEESIHEYISAKQTVKELGILSVESGLLSASDGFIVVDEAIAITIPAGEYPVYSTLVDVSTEQDGSHIREAYLSVKISSHETVEVRPSVPEGKPEPENGKTYGIGVDTGTVAFFDNSNGEVIGQFSDEEFGKVSDALDSSDGQTLIEDSHNGKIVQFAITQAGWGDGFYPLMSTFDKDGELTGIHIDLQVVGTLDEEY